MEYKEYAIQVKEDGIWKDKETYNQRNCAWEDPIENWLPALQEEYRVSYWNRKFPNMARRVVLRTVIEDVVINEAGQTVSHGECSA